MHHHLHHRFIFPQPPQVWFDYSKLLPFQKCITEINSTCCLQAYTIKSLKKVHGYTSYSFKLVSHTHYICKSSFWFPSSRPLNDFVFFSWKDVTKCGSTLTAAEVTTDVKFFGLVKPRSTWICIKWPGAGGGTLTRKIKPDAKRNNFQSWFFVCLCVSLSAPAVCTCLFRLFCFPRILARVAGSLVNYRINIEVTCLIHYSRI